MSAAAAQHGACNTVRQHPRTGAAAAHSMDDNEPEQSPSNGIQDLDSGNSGHGTRKSGGQCASWTTSWNFGQHRNRNSGTSKGDRHNQVMT
jgi:hypothetical protein